jgi:predicted TPR repeat methyltransferase
MKKFTKKQVLYAHIIEARRHREMYNRLTEKHEDAGRTDRAEAAYRNACDYSAKESAYIAAVTIVYGEYGCDLERNLKAFADAYMPENKKEVKS